MEKEIFCYISWPDIFDYRICRRSIYNHMVSDQADRLCRNPVSRRNCRIPAGNLIGPALGALMILHMDMAHVMLVDIVGAVFAIVCLASVKLTDPKKEYTEKDSPNFTAEFLQGLQASKHNIPLYRSMPHYILTGVFYMPVNALFLLLVVSHYHGSELLAGYMEAAAALGVILGSVLIGRFGDIKRKLTIFSLATAAVGLLTFIVGILPPQLFWFAVIVVLALGIVIPFFPFRLEHMLRKASRRRNWGGSPV